MDSLNKFKKSIIVILAVLMILTGCSTKRNPGTLIYVSAKEILNKMENKETFVVYIGSTTCSYCIKFKPEVQKVIDKNDFIMLGVMLDESDHEDANELIEMMALGGTPTTYYVVNGEIKDTLVGFKKADSLKSWLKQNGILK